MIEHGRLGVPVEPCSCSAVDQSHVDSGITYKLHDTITIAVIASKPL